MANHGRQHLLGAPLAAAATRRESRARSRDCLLHRTIYARLRSGLSLLRAAGCARGDVRERRRIHAAGSADPHRAGPRHRTGVYALQPRKPVAVLCRNRDGARRRPRRAAAARLRRRLDPDGGAAGPAGGRPRSGQLFVRLPAPDGRGGDGGDPASTSWCSRPFISKRPRSASPNFGWHWPGSSRTWPRHCARAGHHTTTIGHAARTNSRNPPGTSGGRSRKPTPAGRPTRAGCATRTTSNATTGTSGNSKASRSTSRT